MLYYWLFRIKSYGKLLIYSTCHIFHWKKNIFFVDLMECTFVTSCK
jgi:hypothetical protein